MNKIPLLGPSFLSQTPESFLAYIKSLIRKENTASKDVESVGIVFKANRITIRVKRDPKLVTREEIATLAKEYSKEEMPLLKLFKQRKIGIIYADSDARRETDAAYFQAEKDAKPRKAPRRKNNS